MTDGNYQDLRCNYCNHTIDDSLTKQNPFQVFQCWIDEAYKCEIKEPNAMTLATVDAQQQPHARIVLLKSFNQAGFTFYSNYESAKARELTTSNKASLSFYWPEMERQIRIEGLVEKLPEQESDSYFKTRPRASQISANISRQSQVVESRALLENLVETAEINFGEQEIPRPSFWGGYQLTPIYFEFWQGRPNRLHDRICFNRSNFDPTNWSGARLFP